MVMGLAIGMGIGGVSHDGSYTSYFTVGALPSFFTFTRASSGTYFNSSSTLSTAATDVARFDHDPSTGIAKGLLLAGSRTTYARATNNVGDSWWTKWQTTVPGDSISGPDGTSSMKLVLEAATTQTHIVSKTLTVTAGHYFAMSFFVKAAGRTRVKLSARSNGYTDRAQIDFNLSTAAMYNESVSGGATITDKQIIDCGGGIYRISLSGRTHSTATSVTFEAYLKDDSDQFNYTGDITKGMYLGCCQIEIGTNAAFPTSYIPNTGTTSDATCASDLCSNTNLAALGFNPSGGAVVVYFYVPSIAGSANLTLFTFDDGTSNNNLYARIVAGTGNIRFGSTVAGVGAASNTSNAVVVGALNKAAFSFKDGEFKWCLNGGTVSSAAYSMPDVSEMKLGRNAADGENFFGNVSRFVYYGSDLISATLQALTA